MKNPFSTLVLCATLISCAETHTVVTGYSRGGQPIGTFDTKQYVYGKLNAENIMFGVSHQGNLDIGFKYFTQLVTTLAGAIYYGELQLAKETTTQLYNAGLSNQAIAKINADLAASISKNGLSATESAIKAGLFTPAGTVFKQPGL